MDTVWIQNACWYLHRLHRIKHDNCEVLLALVQLTCVQTQTPSKASAAFKADWQLIQLWGFRESYVSFLKEQTSFIYSFLAGFPASLSRSPVGGTQARVMLPSSWIDWLCETVLLQQTILLTVWAQKASCTFNKRLKYTFYWTFSTFCYCQKGF